MTKGRSRGSGPGTPWAAALQFVAELLVSSSFGQNA